MHFCSAIMGVKVLYVPYSPLTQGPVHIVWVVQGPGYRKTTIRLKDAAVLVAGSPQTGPYTHFCSAIMGVKVLYVPNSPWTKESKPHGMDSTGLP